MPLAPPHGLRIMRPNGPDTPLPQTGAPNPRRPPRPRPPPPQPPLASLFCVPRGRSLFRFRSPVTSSLFATASLVGSLAHACVLNIRPQMSATQDSIFFLATASQQKRKGRKNGGESGSSDAFRRSVDDRPKFPWGFGEVASPAGIGFVPYAPSRRGALERVPRAPCPSVSPSHRGAPHMAGEAVPARGEGGQSTRPTPPLPSAVLQTGREVLRWVCPDVCLVSTLRIFSYIFGCHPNLLPLLLHSLLPPPNAPFTFHQNPVAACRLILYPLTGSSHPILLLAPGANERTSSPHPLLYQPLLLEIY